jgi:hypothetical protein
VALWPHREVGPHTHTHDRSPSRSLARGAQQQPSPPHSGRGHSTAYTHRHFPLPSLVQDCSDDPLALAQAPNPHMPQHVSLRICSQITPPLRSSTFWPRRRPTSHDLPQRHLTAHIARRHCLAFGSYRTYVLGPVPGVDVMAKRSQGWVKCEDRLPYYKYSSCSLPLATTPRPRLRDSRLAGTSAGAPGV